MKTSVIEVSGMVSALSSHGVEKQLGKLRGVHSVTVNFAAGSATVRYDEAKVKIADLKHKVRECGYRSAGTWHPAVDTVHAPARTHDALTDHDHRTTGADRGDQGVAATVATVPLPERAPAPGPTPADASGVVGSTSAPDAAPATTPHVNLTDIAPKPSNGGPVPAVPAQENTTATPTASSSPAPVPPAPPDKRGTPDPPIAAAKPDVAPTDPTAAEHAGHPAPSGAGVMSDETAHEMGHGGGKDLSAMVRDMRNRFWVCLLFSVPIFVYSPMGNLFTPPAPPFGMPLNRWLFFLASAAILYPSWPFAVAAWRALRARTLNMAVLIVLSVGTGYLFSAGATFFFKSGQFFEAVSVLLVFILLGHWLEMRARAGASSAIRALMDLTPPKAFVFRNNAEVEVPTAQVVVGDIVVIRPGNKIPVDGTIETGDSLVDESMLT
ncbi:MAG: cation transporter, partial [Gemmatimonadaceae bacterium]